MPVAGEEYFTKDFYNNHYAEIRRVYESLADEESKNIYSSVLWYKLTGKIDYLFEYYSKTEEIYALIGKAPEVIADCGAYNGDTLKEAAEYFPNLKKAYAFEPDRRNFKKLTAYADEADFEIIATRAAVWSESGEGNFFGSGNRNSTVTATASYENKVEEVSLVAIEDAIKERVDYIKYDVEGAELEALVGSGAIIKEYMPALLVSLYHRSEDLFSLPLYVAQRYAGYKLYIRRTLCLPAWEIALIAVKE
jgi:FkbM family methyltransferase